MEAFAAILCALRKRAVSTERRLLRGLERGGRVLVAVSRPLLLSLAAQTQLRRWGLCLPRYRRSPLELADVRPHPDPPPSGLPFSLRPAPLQPKDLMRDMWHLVRTAISAQLTIVPYALLSDVIYVHVDLEVFIFVQKGSGAALKQLLAGDCGRLMIRIEEAASNLRQAADVAIALFLSRAELPGPIALVTGKDGMYPALVEELRAQHRDVEHILPGNKSILDLYSNRGCAHCACVFASADALAGHKSREHVCPDCGASFGNLLTHRASCNLCHQPVCPAQRNVHMHRMHHACDCCAPPEYFATSDQLHRHRLYMHPFRCCVRDFEERCSTEVERANHLQQQHHVTKGYYCPVCEKPFATAGARDSHSRSHK